MYVNTCFKKRWGPYFPGANPKLDPIMAQRLVDGGYCEIVVVGGPRVTPPQPVSKAPEPEPEPEEPKPKKKTRVKANDSDRQADDSEE